MYKVFSLLLWAMTFLPFSAFSSQFLSSEYERAENFEAALSRINQQPDRFVLVYLGAGPNCPPCHYTQHQLDLPEVISRLKKSVVVVEAFAWGTPVQSEKRTVEKFGSRPGRDVSYAPVLTIVDKDGKQIVRMVGGLSNTRQALLLGGYLSEKHYLNMTFDKYVSTQ